ncbi:MAG TPA: outer membrane beta-barrel protein [Bryobacteraceae bacterium]|nr:outer membrane beta-barrel protein [Bryobacteraceae bacterium]
MALGFVSVCSMLLAQDVPVVDRGTTELAGFVGGSYGIDQFRAMGGGNVGYSVTRNLMPYGEFTYFPGVGRYAQGPTLPSIGTVQYEYPVRLADIHVGVHYRIPLGEHNKFVPYVAAGVGVIHTFTVNNLVASVTLSDGQTISSGPINDAAKSEAAGNFGGGFRIYFDQKFGMRIEAKAYKAQDERVFGKVTVGFFYQIRPKI